MAQVEADLTQGVWKGCGNGASFSYMHLVLELWGTEKGRVS